MRASFLAATASRAKRFFSNAEKSGLVVLTLSWAPAPSVGVPARAESAPRSPHSRRFRTRSLMRDEAPPAAHSASAGAQHSSTHARALIYVLEVGEFAQTTLITVVLR